MRTLLTLIATLVLFMAVPAIAAPAPGQLRDADGDWPMLAHDAARSGATAAEIRPPFARKWYRLFPDEGLMAGVQPIVAGGKVFIGTMAGVLHAMDDATGKDLWTFRAGGPILHAAAADGNLVWFGAGDGKIYGVRAQDGSLAWTVPTGAAVWNAPLVHQGLLVIGGCDGVLYAIDAQSGKIRWTAPLEGPILASPALDAAAGRVYAAAENMHVAALDLRNGRRLWTSPKLPGATFRGYHPVVARDGAVMVTVGPVISLQSIERILGDMVKEIFGDTQNWRYTKQENARLGAENLRKMAEPGTYEAQLAYLRKHLADQPVRQTFFVLDPQTGRQKFVAPIVYAESMNGTGAPPLVTAEGRVVVKYQALLRSRYPERVNVGYLDTASGHITPVMDQSRAYGWHGGLLLVRDEQCQLTAAGRVLINTHQDNVNGMDLETLRGYDKPFCVNIHEARPGEALSIWKRVLSGEPLPAGKEWLIRGSAVYGGGSVLDVPVSVAGKSFYYLPTHEINAGAAVIAYHAQPDGTADRPPQMPVEPLTDEDRAKIAALRWDWDTLDTKRLKHVLDKSGLKPPPGTRRTPLTQQARDAVAKISDDELDRIIWAAGAAPQPAASHVARSPAAAAGGTADSGRQTPKELLARGVQELIGDDWRPLFFPAGKSPAEAYRFFTEPTETLYTLARAYPQLNPAVQQAVQRYVTAKAAPGGPLDGPTGGKALAPNEGRIRSAYDVPPEDLCPVSDDIARSDVARLYPIWLWAHASGDWAMIEKHWKALSQLAGREPNPPSEDWRNGHVAGLIAYCRMARHMKDEAAVERGLAAARAAMRERLMLELAYPAGNVTSEVSPQRTIFARSRRLTPEVARLLSTHAGPQQRSLVELYVDHHRPAWWLAWNVELAWRNESPFSFPTLSTEIFAAKALLVCEPAEKLRQYVDIPWCQADLFYLQKLVYCIEAGPN